MVNEVPQRNRNMCESIENALKTHDRVFVMAGSHHFECPEEYEREKGIDYRPAEEAIRETTFFLETTKVAILLPKENG